MKFTDIVSNLRLMFIGSADEKALHAVNKGRVDSPYKPADDYEALCTAVIKFDVDRVRYYLRKGVDVSKDQALVQAVFKGNSTHGLEMAQLLLDHGMKVHPESLKIAARQASTEMLRLLFKYEMTGTESLINEVMLAAEEYRDANIDLSRHYKRDGRDDLWNAHANDTIRRVKDVINEASVARPGTSLVELTPHIIH